MFRLDKVLRYREMQEREARAVRAEYERRADAMADSMRQLREDRAEIPEGDEGAADAERIRELAAWAAWAESLRRKESSLGRRLAEFRPRVEEKVQAHAELRREVEGLRKLRARAIAHRKKERERKQQETIDDAAARRKVPRHGMDFRPDAARPSPQPLFAGPKEGVEHEMNPDRGTGR